MISQQNIKLGISLISLGAVLLLLYSASSANWNTFTFKASSNIDLDGCYHVYLDVGTNVGVQIRKLYEPKLYPGAPIHSAFDKYFNRSETTLPYICAVGFEPNPKHEEWLQSKYSCCFSLSLCVNEYNFHFRVRKYLQTVWMETSCIYKISCIQY